jgi:hypothetical protein
MSTTKEQLVAGLDMLRALAATVKELGEVPSGQLYAHVMDRMTLPTYEKAIGLLIGSTIIVKRGDVLVWNVIETPEDAAHTAAQVRAEQIQSNNFIKANHANR